MDIKDFKAGAMKNGAGYKYFLPEKINHSYVWTDETINELVSEQQDIEFKSQLPQLQNEGIIRRIGPDRNRHWEVMQLEKKMIMSNFDELKGLEEIRRKQDMKLTIILEQGGI